MQISMRSLKRSSSTESLSRKPCSIRPLQQIGIIAKSSLFSPQLSHFKEAIHWSDVEEGLYTPIDQGMVLLSHAKDNAEAKAFYDFILGDKSKKILRDFGYKVQ